MQPHLHDAVRAVYSNVVTIHGNDIGDLTCLDVNGVSVMIDSDTVTNRLETLQNEYVTSQTEKSAAKQSAITKLTALGLTSDEINALIS
jgi:hypothetical protein